MAEETDGAALAADLAERLERLPTLVNGDPWLVERGRFVTLDILVELGRIPFKDVIAASVIMWLNCRPSAPAV